MIPNLGGLDPRRIQSMMKQMGIENKELSAKRVIIECDNETLIIENPAVSQISMQGQTTFQVAGDVKSEKVLMIPDEDIDMVSEATNVSKEEAKKLLEETEGDIAKAISLKQE